MATAAAIDNGGHAPLIAVRLAILEKERAADRDHRPPEAKRERDGVRDAQAAADGERRGHAGAAAGNEHVEPRLAEDRPLRRQPEAPLHDDRDERVVAA